MIASGGCQTYEDGTKTVRRRYEDGTKTVRRRYEDGTKTERTDEGCLWKRRKV